MSKKSERKHLSRSKRKKIKSGPITVSEQQSVVSRVSTVSSHREATQPVRESELVKGSVSEAKPVGERYTDVSVEVRRIGILAGIILAVLAVLAVALP